MSLKSLNCIYDCAFVLIALLYNANLLHVHDQCLSVFTGSFVLLRSLSQSLDPFLTCNCLAPVAALSDGFMWHCSQLQLLSSLLL